VLYKSQIRLDFSYSVFLQKYRAVATTILEVFRLAEVARLAAVHGRSPYGNRRNI
jgi:hypothetical protein